MSEIPLATHGRDEVGAKGRSVAKTTRLEGLESADLPRLLRDVYAAAVGGTGDDWVALDEVMAAEHHTAVLIRPRCIYSNPDR